MSGKCPEPFGAAECVCVALIVFTLMYLSFQIGRWVG